MWASAPTEASLTVDGIADGQKNPAGNPAGFLLATVDNNDTASNGFIGFQLM